MDTGEWRGRDKRPLAEGSGAMSLNHRSEVDFRHDAMGMPNRWKRLKNLSFCLVMAVVLWV